MQASIGQGAAFRAEAFASGRADSASTPNASNSSTTNSATVSANDFLELLVTEMKNQDPTANTDPNEYINQLVQVNSLEQLMQINQDLGGSSSTSGSSGTSGSASNTPAETSSGAAIPSTGQNALSSDVQSGNLAQPDVSGAAARVAQALQRSSPAASAADLQNLIRAPRAHAGAAHPTISSAR